MSAELRHKTDEDSYEQKSENEEAGKKKQIKIEKIGKKNQSPSRQSYVWKEKRNEHKILLEK